MPSLEDSLFNNCGLPAVLGMFPTFTVNTNGKTLRSGVESRLEINNLPRQLNRATLTLDLYASEGTKECAEIFEGSTCRVTSCKAVLPFKFKKGPVYVSMSVKTRAGEELARIDSLIVDSRQAELVYNEIHIDYSKNDVGFVPYEHVSTPQPSTLPQPQTSEELTHAQQLAQELSNLEQLSRVLSQRIRSLSDAIQPAGFLPSGKTTYERGTDCSVELKLDQLSLHDGSPVA